MLMKYQHVFLSVTMSVALLLEEAVALPVFFVNTDADRHLIPSNLLT